MMEDLYKKHLSKVLNTFDKILEKYDYEELVLYSGEQKTVYADDNTYPFKCDFNFKYLVPIENYPYSFVSYKSGEKPQLILFQKEDYWDSQPKDIEGFWTKYFKITYYSKLEKINSFFKRDLSKNAILGEELKRFEKLNFKAFNDQNIINHIAYARSLKSSYEVACIKEANKIASKAHKASYKAFLNGASEFETHLEYLKAIAFKESEVPYANIVAFNENSAILHYVDYNKEKIDAKSFLLDAGASYNGYASDITRTFSKNSSDEFQALIKAVDDSTKNIISQIKVGLNYEILQEQMHKDVAQILVDFKLMNISKDEIYEERYTKLFSPAGVGHYIGLQVHDIGNFIKDEDGALIEKSKEHPFLRLRRDIEVGNVFTIEPGIYIIEQLLRPFFTNKKFNWDNINKLRVYGGVRVEDNISVEKNGVFNLTRDFFKELD